MISTSPYLIPFFICFGLLIGSFLNVVIARVPHGKSVIHPRSKCPKCGHQIKWHENIPVISYIFLKAKCSKCKSPIGIRYPLIEIFMGLIAYLLTPQMLNVENGLIFLYFFFTACVLVSHFFIDIEHQLLPDKINIFYLIITLIYVSTYKSFNFWFIGGLLGFCLPYFVTWAFYKIKGQIGLGGGDIKLFGILGLFLGPIGVIQNMFFSCTLGSIVGVALILSGVMKRNAAMAFGPFIILTAALQIYFPYLFESINFFSLR